MNVSSKRTSSSLKIGAAVIIVVLIIVGVYAAFTYPRTVLSFPVSFSLLGDFRREPFEVPILDSWIRVEVAISSGASLWMANVASTSESLWNHTAIQGEQTSYDSGWITLSSGSYNFTFATLGIGPLSGEITINSKGGFW